MAQDKEARETAQAKEPQKRLIRQIREAAGDLVDAGTHIDVAKSARLIGRKLGLNDRLINYTHIELRNKLLEPKFKGVPFKERILFLPHCLRSTEHCKGKYGDEGLVCAGCGNCKIFTISKMAKALGYEGVFVTPGGSMVAKIIKKYRPKAVLGVACTDELTLAADKLRENGGMAAQGVMLMRSGCKDTDVNIEEVWEKLVLGNGHDEEKLGKLKKKFLERG